MMNAYNELYIEDAAQNLGEYLDYMVNSLHYAVDYAFELLAYSSVGRQFELGNPKYVTGMSGRELAVQVIYSVFNRWQQVADSWDCNRSSEYWTGWAIAQYQWRCGSTFRQMIEKGLNASKIESKYILHEADISKFYEWADIEWNRNSQRSERTIQRLRKYAKLTQKELSEKSGVSLRMIQLYEQGQNDLKKAQAEVVYMLAKALNTTVEELLD